MSKYRTTNTGSDFDLAPTGTHSGVLTRWIEKGTQDGQFGPKRKVLLVFELDAERKQDGQRFAAFANYTASLHTKAALRKDLESWRGQRFPEDYELDPRNLLGKPALINIVHSEDGQYANIASLSPLPRGMQPLQPVGELLYFDVDDPDLSILDQLSENLRSKIEASPEYREAMSGPGAPPAEVAAVDFDDEIPF